MLAVPEPTNTGSVAVVYAVTDSTTLLLELEMVTDAPVQASTAASAHRVPANGTTTTPPVVVSAVVAAMS